jgi:hypothetical protein
VTKLIARWDLHEMTADVCSFHLATSLGVVLAFFPNPCQVILDDVDRVFAAVPIAPTRTPRVLVDQPDSQLGR